MTDGPLDAYIHTYYNEHEISWDRDKSVWLKSTRGYSFAELVWWPLIDSIAHPTRPHQRMLLLLNVDYVWGVPAVVRDGEVFLKTAFPSRRFTKRWKEKSA